MTDFTASNGGWVRATPDGRVRVSALGASWDAITLTKAEAQALREFFQHERDQELGRWRDPENPDWVVYAEKGGDDFRVMDEATGDTWTYEWSAIKDDPRYNGPWNAARAYFEAHPEPKPWHDAKEGEAWVILYNGDEFATIFQAGAFRDHGGSWSPDEITDAVRIWPKGDSDG